MRGPVSRKAEERKGGRKGGMEEERIKEKKIGNWGKEGDGERNRQRYIKQKREK